MQRRRDQPPIALCGEQACCRALHPDDRGALGNQDHCPAHLQRLWSRAAHSSIQLISHPTLHQTGARRRIAGHFRSRRPDADFVYVSDVVRALVSALHIDPPNRCIINIGSGTEITINALAREILTQTGSSSNTIYSPVRGGAYRACTPTSRLHAGCWNRATGHVTGRPQADPAGGPALHLIRTRTPRRVQSRYAMLVTHARVATLG